MIHSYADALRQKSMKNGPAVTNEKPPINDQDIAPSKYCDGIWPFLHGWLDRAADGGKRFAMIDFDDFRPMIRGVDRNGKGAAYRFGQETEPGKCLAHSMMPAEDHVDMVVHSLRRELPCYLWRVGICSYPYYDEALKKNFLVVVW